MLLAILALLFHACKTSTIGFEKGGLDGFFVEKAFKSLYASELLYLADTFPCDTIRYEAVFEQRLVPVDHIGQYTITNSLSDHTSLIPVQGSRHVLYLYLYVDGGVEKVLFLSAYYNADRACISLGPAYTGLLSTSHIQLTSIHKIRKQKERFYLSDRGVEQTDIRFYADRPFRRPDGGFEREIRFNRVVRKKNIYPAEYLIFDIPQIFQDPAALAFTLKNN